MKNRQAEAVYIEGLKNFPNSEQLNYDAAYFYIQAERKENALVYIRKLKMLNPSNPDYAEMFKMLGP